MYSNENYDRSYASSGQFRPMHSYCTTVLARFLKRKRHTTVWGLIAILQQYIIVRIKLAGSCH